MKKRITSLLLVLAMCFAMLPTTAFAVDDEGSTMPAAYSGGSGTQKDPWIISSVKDLQLLANTINDGKAAGFDADSANIGNYHGYYFKQTADLDLSSMNWNPIGYSGGCYFAGHYDGDGHTISKAKSTGKNDDDGFATAGIFGWVAFGSVQNLHVKNANFLAIGQNNYSYVGGIAGVCYGSSIKNCSVVNSSLESKRNNNNNCAGSIVGYSTGGTFEKCAAENNQVKTMAYGGGFVGEVDDDPSYGAGTSTFTNCYTANCSVSSKTDDVQGVSLVGGFVGEMTDSALTVNNCYVYRAMLSTEGTAVPGIKATGVFAGHLWGGSSIVDTNCFFGACGTTENAGTASEKTEEEFRNGTVAGLLGEAFAQVGDYPKINGPADYSSVDAAIDKVNALNKDNYKDFSAVEAAVGAVVRDKKIAEQSAVDAIAKAIEDAIAALQYKGADYTKVDEALAKANALNKDSYQDFSAVEKAIADVVRDKNITEQSKVDAMAKAIEDAIAGLVPRPSSSSSSSSSSKPSYSVTAPGTAENGSVTVSPKNATKGSTVTVTVKPNDGYQLDKLTVADAKGNTISVTDKGNGKYTFTMPASKVTVTPKFVKIAQQPTKKTFVDVDKSDWFADAVAYVTEKGLMNGTGSDTFSPNASTTRGMLMTVLARYAGEDT
ncbi:S-layer homology domain-containing protein, partial [Agathobaculum butyriciproducens]|uniref:S-layer homology domain-containing protein n=1 Tax=Agathobaculum butyriciproducens TaxID=1628085 RepID=UPI0032C021E6